MATEVKSRRGTTAQHAAFIGGSGEITVDTTKNVDVVHDGITPGGTPMAKEADVVVLQGETATLEAGQTAHTGQISDLGTGQTAHTGQITDLDTRTDALEASQTTGTLVLATWVELLAVAGGGEGEGGEVLDSDAGTHLAASATGYDGAVVDNAGRYSWNDTWARWVRIGDTGLTGKADKAEFDAVDARTSGVVSDLVTEPLSEDIGWILAFKRGGKLVMGVDTSGKLFGVMRDGAVMRDWLSEEVTSGLMPATTNVVALGAEAGWALAVGDAISALGFRTDGEVVGRLLDKYMRVRRSGGGEVRLLPRASIVNLGDSTAAGSGASGDDARWYGLLSAALGTSTVNLGIGGQTSEQIAARFGAVETAITVSGDTITSTGSTSVTSISVSVLHNGSSTTTLTLAGTVAGVRVILTKTGTSTYNIAREAEGGGDIACPAGTLFFPETGELYRDDILILQSGTNSRSDPYGTIEYLAATVKRLKPYFRAVLVVSPRGLNTEIIGSAVHDNLLTMERLGQKVFGDAWVDLRRFLIDDALGVLDYLGDGPIRDAGQIAQDDADIANDVTPTSLRTDTIHSNDYGQAAEAWLYQSILQTRGIW